MEVGISLRYEVRKIDNTLYDTILVERLDVLSDILGVQIIFLIWNVVEDSSKNIHQYTIDNLRNQCE